MESPSRNPKVPDPWKLELEVAIRVGLEDLSDEEVDWLMISIGESLLRAGTQLGQRTQFLLIAWDVLEAEYERRRAEVRSLELLYRQ
jgi:hypothetical protein